MSLFKIGLKLQSQKPDASSDYLQSTSSKEEKTKDATGYSFTKDESTKSKAAAIKIEKSKDVIGEGKTGPPSSGEDQPRTKVSIKLSSFHKLQLEAEKLSPIPLPGYDFLENAGLFRLI